MAEPRETTTGPPDFIGVGSQRCGTTWWFRVMAGHPAIRAPRRRKKELHFFDQYAVRPLTRGDIARYHERFPRRPGQVVGEWTPRYMRDFWTPGLLRRAAPDARLLVMLRDPVERYRSGVAHRRSRTPNRRPDALASDAIERGRYALQIRRLLAHFDPERILVLQYEKCREDPTGQYRRTIDFLGVPEPDEPPDFGQPRGTTTAPEKQELWPDFTRAIQVALQDDVRDLPDLVPGVELALWPNFAHLA